MMTGRMMAWHMYEFFKLTEIDGALLDFNDLLKVRLRSENLSGFIYHWEMTLAGMKDIPTEAYVESLFREQLERCTQKHSLPNVS